MIAPNFSANMLPLSRASASVALSTTASEEIFALAVRPASLSSALNANTVPNPPSTTKFSTVYFHARAAVSEEVVG